VQDDLVPLAKAGVKGFKCFLIESGVDEFPAIDEDQVLTAMPKLTVSCRRSPSKPSTSDFNNY